MTFFESLHVFLKVSEYGREYGRAAASLDLSESILLSARQRLFRVCAIRSPILKRRSLFIKYRLLGGVIWAKYDIKLFFKKSSQKTSYRYTRFARVRTPTRGVVLKLLSAMFINYAEKMCLYPRLIINRKYRSTKKNGGNIPPCPDERVKYVPIGCGRCIECRKQKAREWKVRLNEELHENPNAHFVTFTFDETKLNELCKELHTENADIISTIAIRRFTERWRKKYKKAPRHFLINELGHSGTERLHFHGLIWYDNIPHETLEQIWQYGIIWVGEYVNEKTINYIVKYVTKLDTDHKNFQQRIFVSRGMGAKYTERPNAELNKYKGVKTREYYTLSNGLKVALPIYYRNKIYTEEEREKLWLNKLDNQIQYILGIEHYMHTDEQIQMFEEHLKNAQQYNEMVGYGKPLEKWDKITYKVKRDKLRALTHKK